MVCAFIDESIRRKPEGLYVVAAAVIAREALDDARSAVRSVLKPRQARFHWRHESAQQRWRMVKTMQALGAPVRAYAVRAQGNKLDRARALCLEGLLWELEELGIGELLFESRQEHNDAKDRRLIIHTQKTGGAPAQLSYRFERPSMEPLLWVADAAAGIVTTALSGEDTSYSDELGQLITLVQVGWR